MRIQALFAACTLALTPSAAALAATPASAQSDLPTASELIGQAQAKRGDAGKLKSLKNLRIKGSVRMTGMDASGAFEELHASDGAALVKSSLPTFGEFNQGTDGRTYWDTNPMLGARIRDADEATIYQRIYAQTRGTNWQQLYHSSECTGIESIDGKPHYKLVMQTGSDKPDVWLIEKDSHLLTRVEMEVPSAMGGMLTLRMTFSDWKAVDGLLYPFKKRVEMGPARFEQTLESVQHDVELTADAFALPPEIEQQLAEQGSDKPPAQAFKVQEMELQHVASIRFQCKPEEISRHLSVALPEVMMHLNATSTKTVGPPFSRYFEYGEMLDVEAGIPVASKIADKGRIKGSSLPAGSIASGWHVGSYHTISASHAALETWVAESPYESLGAPWELYWTDPGMEPDPNKWRTQLFLPVVRE
jgi:effector-binding domain-containing protein